MQKIYPIKWHSTNELKTIDLVVKHDNGVNGNRFDFRRFFISNLCALSSLSLNIWLLFGGCECSNELTGASITNQNETFYSVFFYFSFFTKLLCCCYFDIVLLFVLNDQRSIIGKRVLELIICVKHTYKLHGKQIKRNHLKIFL